MVDELSNVDIHINHSFKCVKHVSCV